MSWKSLGVLIATLAFCASLTAQDKKSEPFLGIWELNLEKTANYPQQSQTMINVPAPGGGFISTRATSLSTESLTKPAEAMRGRFPTNSSIRTRSNERTIDTEKSLSIRNRSPRTARQ